MMARSGAGLKPGLRSLVRVGAGGGVNPTLRGALIRVGGRARPGVPPGGAARVECLSRTHAASGAQVWWDEPHPTQREHDHLEQVA